MRSEEIWKKGKEVVLTEHRWRDDRKHRAVLRTKHVINRDLLRQLC